MPENLISSAAAPAAPARADRTWLVALAACFWGLSALWRGPLAQQHPSLTIVLWEHLILTTVTLPLLLPALRRLRAAGLATQLAVVVIGMGSSALATVLFTAAFRVGDPITPQVLQKLQPVIAIVLAALILGERLRRSYWFFLLPALVGAWLMTFADPFSVSVTSARAALLALGAATLWAAGTVLGRLAGRELRFADLVALRFTLGLVALAAVAVLTSAPLTLPWSAAPSILALVAFPGLSAMVLYYLALGRTAASRATLAELAFPLTAALIGVLAFDARPAPSQWAGMAILLATVVTLALHEQRASTPAVTEEVEPTVPHTGATAR